MKKAFSLVELLVSLVVISLIVTALVPIMTKKMSKSNMVVKIAAAKKGLQIYTNPGTYAFDVPESVDKIYFAAAGGGGGGAGATKTTNVLTYGANGTFTVPNGVNKITLKITAAGGGGGAANGVPTSTVAQGTLDGYTKGTLYNDRCLSDEMLLIRGKEDETDSCMTKYDPVFYGTKNL